MKRILIGGFALFASGCATAPTDISFGGGLSSTDGTSLVETPENEAVLLLAIGPIGTAGGYMFQRLNEDETDFGAKPTSLAFAAYGAGDKMKRPEDEKSSLWLLDQKEVNFLIKKVEAGSYAATYVTWNTYNGVSSGSAWNCMNEGAFVFDIKPGMINIVSSRDAVAPGTLTRLANSITDDEVLEQFSRTRLNYPGLKGDAVISRPVSEARWTEQKGGLFAGECQAAVPGSFTLNAIGIRQTKADPDAAERAAIAAALANIEKAGNLVEAPGDVIK